MPLIANMIYFIYQTTDLSNGMYYIGKHKTNNIDDGYLGSGIHLTAAIRKRGKDNFVREIISFHEDDIELTSAEIDIVTQEIVDDPNSYNLCIGGDGGDKSSGRVWINNGIIGKRVKSTELDVYISSGWELGQSAAHIESMCAELRKRNWWYNPSTGETQHSIENPGDGFIEGRGESKRKGIPSNISDEQRKHLAECARSFHTGRKKPESMKKKLSDKKWISKDEKTIRISNSELDAYLTSGWKLGRIMKRGT